MMSMTLMTCQGKEFSPPVPAWWGEELLTVDATIISPHKLLISNKDKGEEGTKIIKKKFLTISSL